VSQAHPVRVLVVGDPYMPAGSEASSTTLGLIGLGNVGRAVAVRAQALGFTVLGHDPAPAEAVPAGVAMIGFEELLGRSDIVAGQLPDHLLNPEIAAHKEAAS
jgi:phosphoglycerate dehydrogenase-like enzyme